MTTFHLTKDGLHYEVEAEDRDEAIAKVLKHAAERNAPEESVDLSGEIPQVPDIEAYERDIRASLEAELAAQNQQRDQAQERLDFAEAPVGEQMMRSAAQVGANLGHIPRLALDAPAAFHNEVLRQPGQPVFQGVANVPFLQNLGRGDYVPPTDWELPPWSSAASASRRGRKVESASAHFSTMARYCRSAAA